MGNNRAGRPMAARMRLTRRAVATPCRWAATYVLPRAWGASPHATRSCARSPTWTKLRGAWRDANGSGQGLSASPIRAARLACTPAP